VTSPRWQSGVTRDPLLPQGASHGFLAGLIAILLASQAFAQVDVTASLDLTDGYARAGAYIPVKLKATNRTGETLEQVHVDSGGPIDVTARWRLAPGETATILLPVFYAGGDLGLTLEFINGSGHVAARIQPAPPTVRPLPPDTALVAIQTGLPEPDEALKAKLQAALAAKALNFLQTDLSQALWLARCGMAGAILADDVHRSQLEAAGAAVIGYAGAYKDIAAAPMPPGAGDMVQPKTCALLATKPWPAEDRLRLWAWLAVFALAVLVAGTLVPRRRRVMAAGAMVAVAALATAFVWFFGDVRRTHEYDASIFYVSATRTRASVERLVLLESRGGAEFNRSFGFALPLPVLDSSDELFRPVGTLRCDYGHDGEEFSFAGRLPQCLLHTFATCELPLGAKVAQIAPAELAAIGKRADVLAALLINGDRATDAAGKSQALDAWAVEWRASADPDLAYAGRSLAWWDRARREGDEPALLVWWRDPLPPAEAESASKTRLPALAVYTAE